MPKTVLLNNVDHKELRVITQHRTVFGDNVMTAFTFAQEFRSLQAHYPIVFYKSDDGTGFQSAVLLGFEEGENLFLGPSGWDATYVPMSMRRQPFFIGMANGEMVIHVDLDSPRISTTQGEPVFLEHGGTTDFLEKISSTLRSIHEGLETAPAFSAALLANDLLESFVFDIEMADGTQSRLSGFYTINEERLSKLDGKTLERLHQAGFLQPIFMAIASLSNLPQLAERKLGSHAPQA